MSTTNIESPLRRPGSAVEVAGLFDRLRSELAAVASWVEDDAETGALGLAGEVLHQVLLGLVGLDSVLDAHTAAVAEAWRTEGFWGVDGSRVRGGEAGPGFSPVGPVGSGGVGPGTEGPRGHAGYPGGVGCG